MTETEEPGSSSRTHPSLMEESRKSTRRLKPLLKLSSVEGPVIFFLQRLVRKVSPSSHQEGTYLMCLGGCGSEQYFPNSPKSHFESDLSRSFLVNDGGASLIFSTGFSK